MIWLTTNLPLPAAEVSSPVPLSMQVWVVIAGGADAPAGVHTVTGGEAPPLHTES